MKYQLVQTVEGQQHSTIFEVPPADIFAAMEVRGYEFAGIEKQTHLRPELQGEPKFTGLYGPMWGGEDAAGYMVRYEDPETYRVLST